MSKIQNAILKASGMDPQKETEDRSTYLSRLARAAAELSQDDWLGLGEDAQEWANSAITALNDQLDLPDLPDGDDGVAPPAVKPKRKRGGGKILRMHYLKDSSLTLEELIEKVEAEGFAITKSSAEVALYETKSTLKALETLGLYTHKAPASA